MRINLLSVPTSSLNHAARPRETAEHRVKLTQPNAPTRQNENCWIQAGIDFIDATADCIRCSCFGNQSLMWGRGGAIRFVDTRSVALLSFQFERRLEKVHEQAGRTVKLS